MGVVWLGKGTVGRANGGTQSSEALVGKPAVAPGSGVRRGTECRGSRGAGLGCPGDGAGGSRY